MEKKIGKLIKKISLIFAITLIIAFLLMTIGDKIKSNITKENEEAQIYQEWLSENCQCLTKGRIVCPTGFEMVNKTCMNEIEKTFINKLNLCSQYNCTGEIKLWNNETNKWENKSE